MPLEVRRYRFGYAVFDGPTVVSGEHSCRDTALRRMDNIARKAKVKAVAKRRPCMCCGVKFDSSGPFNRLCLTCRQTAAAMPQQMVG